MARIKGDLMKQLSYYPLECTLLKRKINKTYLQKKTKLSTTTIAKIKKNEPISLNTLMVIAGFLDCDIKDLISFETVN